MSRFQRMIIGADHGEQSSAAETKIRRALFALVEKLMAESLSAEIRQQHGFAKIENVPDVDSGGFDGFAEILIGFGKRDSCRGSDDLRAMLREDDQASFLGNVFFQIIHLVSERAVVEIRKIPKNRDTQARDFFQKRPRGLAGMG